MASLFPTQSVSSHPLKCALQIGANASLGLPPVLVGLVLFLAFSPQGPFGSLQLNVTRRSVFIAQTILALPYTIALSAAAVQALPSRLLDQARLFGAGRRQACEGVGDVRSA